MPCSPGRRRKIPLEDRLYRWRGKGPRYGQRCRFIGQDGDRYRMRFDDGEVVECVVGQLRREKTFLAEHLLKFKHKQRLSDEHLEALRKEAERHAQLRDSRLAAARNELAKALEDYTKVGNAILTISQKYRRTLSEFFPLEELRDAVDYVAYLVQATLPGCACPKCIERGHPELTCLCGGKCWLNLSELVLMAVQADPSFQDD